MLKHTIGRKISRPVRSVWINSWLMVACLVSGVAAVWLYQRWISDTFLLELVSSLVVLGKLLFVISFFGLTVVLGWSFLAGFMAAWNDNQP